MTENTCIGGGELVSPLAVGSGLADDRVAGRNLEEHRASLLLLGSWAMRRDGALVPVTSSAQRLLVLLALRGRQRRAYASAVLWPDVLDEQALTRLRCTLWRIRRQCGDVLEVGEQTVALSSMVTVDVDRLVATAREVIEGRTRLDQLDARCAMLIDLPELLLGWYEDWVLQERDRINQLRVRALETLVDLLILAGRHSGAFEAATAATRLDPLRESTHRAVIRVYLAEGNPALAKRQLDRYRQILRAELGVDEPTSEMLKMVDWPPVAPTTHTRGPSPARR